MFCEKSRVAKVCRRSWKRARPSLALLRSWANERCRREVGGVDQAPRFRCEYEPLIFPEPDLLHHLL